MDERRTSSGRAFGRRLAWALFFGVSALALGALVLTAHATGGRTTAGLVLLGGLLAIGIATLLVSAMVSPLPNPDASRQVAHGYSGTGVGDGYDGGGYGGDS